jgi:DNA-binding XRE family transcriptional regulator
MAEELTQVAKYPAICKRFKAVRIQHELTQTEFGQMLGTTKQSIAKLENLRGDATIKLILNLKKRFKVSYEWILDGK